MKNILTTGRLLVLICISFVIGSCQQKTSVPDKKNTDNIEKYLDTKVMETAYNGKVFSAHKVFMEQDNKIYLWAYMQEYYKRDGKTLLGSGWSVPLILTIENSPEGITVKGHTAPRDGELYSLDVKDLFPEKIRQEIFDFPGTQEMRQLQEISLKRSEKL